jgi:hypothetical protein
MIKAAAEIFGNKDEDEIKHGKKTIRFLKGNRN